jgi:hypothetical protein
VPFLGRGVSAKTGRGFGHDPVVVVCGPSAGCSGGVAAARLAATARYYIAEVEYRDTAGTPHLIEDSFGWLSPRPAVEQGVAIVYPEHAPQHGRVPHPLVRGWLYAVVLGMVGVLLARMLDWIPAGSG